MTDKQILKWFDTRLIEYRSLARLIYGLQRLRGKSTIESLRYARLKIAELEKQHDTTH